MNATEAIREMMRSSGMTATELSRAMGRSDSYIRTTLANGTSPRVDNLALMAEIMGFEIALLDTQTGEVRTRISALKRQGLI